jgi:hypothetical protein
MTKIPAGSFVLPDDVIGRLGGGNYHAGIGVLIDLFASEPYLSMKGPHILPPQVVADFGHGNLQTGRKVLSRFVSLTRRQHREARQ